MENKANQCLVPKARNYSLRHCLFEMYWSLCVNGSFRRTESFSTYFWKHCAIQNGWMDFFSFYELKQKKKKARPLLLSPHHEQHVMLDQHRPRLCLLWLPGSGPLCRGGVLHRFTISLLTPQEACRVRRTHVHRRMGQDSLNRLSSLLPLQKCLSVVQAVASLPLFPCSSTLKTATNLLPVLAYKNDFTPASSY